jgi:hypothetical protein
VQVGREQVAGNAGGIEAESLEDELGGFAVATGATQAIGVTAPATTIAGA